MADRPATFSPNRLRIDPRAWIAPGAVVVGDVTLGPDVSIWYGCVLRGDLEPISVGAGTNIQDLSVIHVDWKMPARIGQRVTIAHRAVVHGCQVGDDALIGIGAVLLSGCSIGKAAVVAAGSVVREGFQVPDGAIAAGVPARIRGDVGPDLERRVRVGVETYLQCSSGYREGSLGGGDFGGGTSCSGTAQDLAG